MAIDSVGNRRTPERNNTLLGGRVVERLTPATVTVGSAGTTLTAAQLFKKLIPLNCTDTGNLTLPTATAIMDAEPGLNVGDVFEFILINFGDSTASVVVGTGITNKSIDSEDAVLDVATHQCGRFFLVCTGKANPSDPSTSHSFDLYGGGVTTAATS